MAVITLIGLGLVLALCPTIRCAFFHPVKLVRYGAVDLFQYLKYRKWNECRTGELVAYVGLFGKGKTLSAVHKVVSMYEQYDGKPVWDKDRAIWVEQRVKVLSNVALSIPYDDFVSLQQVVYCAEKNGQYDKEHDTLTVTLVLGDEFSVQMNSRNFKSNIDPLFLNTLLTCRHYHISMYYTAQRFGHVDALLRQVTSCVVDCDKLWRFQRQNLYDAWEMENATNTQLLTPLTRRCWFVTNKDYAAYDTLACVGNLQKSFKEGDMLSEEEILSLRRNEQQANMDGVVKPSRKWRRSQKRYVSDVTRPGPAAAPIQAGCSCTMCYSGARAKASARGAPAYAAASSGVCQPNTLRGYRFIQSCTRCTSAGDTSSKLVPLGKKRRIMRLWFSTLPFSHAE